MATSIFLYSKLTSPTLQREGRSGLEDDIDEFLGAAGSTTGGGAGSNGWNVDLELVDDEQLEQWIERLSAFLRSWGVPTDSYLKVFPNDWTENDPVQTVFVFPEQAHKL